ncbi:MAG: Ig-like domain-containing protein, partial [Thermoplasmata archaeon]
GITAADWNKDGLVDLVVSAYNAGGGNGVYAYANTRNGAMWSSASSGLPDDGDYIENAVGDLDGDGDPDIVTAGSYGGEYGVHVYYGDGSGSWSEDSQGLNDNTQYVGVDLGDYNGDGTLDIVVGKRTRGGGIEVWKNPSGVVPPPLPELEITYPAGGESLTGGSSHQVTWTLTSGTPGYSLSLKYSTDSGATYTQVIDESVNQADAGDGSVTWDVPVINSEKVRVRAEVLDAADQTVTRSGRDFVVDSTPPVVSSSFPRSGSEGVSTSSMVIITFNEGMAEASADAVTIAGPGSPTLSDASWSGTQLTLATDGLEPESLYTVTVATTAMDDSLPGNAMANPHGFTFTTGSGDAPSPPIVQYTTPEHDATDVGLGTSLRVGFSKAMDTTVTQGAVSLQPSVSWSPVWSDGDTVLTVVP